MANPALAQASKSVDSGSNTGSISITTTAGNALIVLLGLDSGVGGTLTSVKENSTTAFVQDYAPVAVNGISVFSYRLQSCVGGAETINLVFAGTSFWDAVAYEISGLAASPYLAAASANGGTATTTETLTAAAAIGASAPALAFAFVEDEGADSGWSVSSASQTAGWASGDSGINLGNGGGFKASHLLATTSQTPSCVFTATQGSGISAEGLIVAYAGVASGSTDPFPLGYRDPYTDIRSNAIYRM